MITKMKKLTFVVYHKEYESFLQQIRLLGVVHIVERQRGEMDETLQSYLQKRSLYKNLLTTMQRQAGEGAVDKTVHTELSADEIITTYDTLQLHIQDLSQQLPTCEKEMAQLDPWGDFDWKVIEQLRNAGWFVQFYDCVEREYDAEWETEYNAVVIREQGGHINFITITPCLVNLGMEPLRFPTLSLSQLRQRKGEIEAEIGRATEKLTAFCSTYSHTLEYYNRHLQGDIDLWKVKLNSAPLAEGSVILLEGWIPEENEADIRHLLDDSSVYYEIRNAMKEDAAPIKLKNNAFIRMYEILTKMYGMPDYVEFDPTPVIAPFFSLFFALCLGDAGYGLMLILLGFFLKKKLSKSLAGLMNLVITLGAVTTVIGAVLGTFFGLSLFDMDLPEWMKQFMVIGKVGETNYDKSMLLALLIGVFHICFAMTVKAICSTVRYGFKESLSAWGWLLLVVGFVCTGGLSFFEIISEDVSTWAFIIIGSVSAIGIYLLNNIHRNVFVNIGSGLWDTYNMATGLLGDTLSYMRLYALGLAGGMLGGVFNQLAFMVNDAAGPVIGWLLCGLILVFGHALNIAMSCLSAFVHPLRLTFVEYFKNSGYEGKGEAYTPFSVVEEK